METILSIYIDFDSLFDTRLAKLSLVRDEALEDIIPVYHKRETDDFEVLTDKLPDDYREQFAKLEAKDVARSSYLTTMIEFLNGAVKDHMRKGVPVSQVDITLNFYGYPLSDDVKERYCVIASDILQANVKSASYCSKMIGFSHFTDFNMVFMYDMKSWLEKHIEEIAAAKGGSTVFYMPKLKPSAGVLKDMHGKEVEDKELLEKVSKIDSFEALEFLFAAYLTIKTLPVAFYCGLPKGLTQSHRAQQ